MFVYFVVQWAFEHIWSISALLVGFMIYRWWSFPHKKFPPGVRGYPLVGAIPYFGKYPEKVFAKWSREKYGPIITIRMGIHDTVFIHSYDILNKV